MSMIDPKNARLIASAKTPGILYGIALDEKRRMLYGAGMDGALYSLDLSNPRASAVKKWNLHDNYVSSLILSGDVLISSGYDGTIIWSNVSNGEVIRSVAAHDGWVRKLAASEGGLLLTSVGDDMKLKIWDGKTGNLVSTWTGHDAKVPEGYLSAMYAVAVSPDAQFAATGDRAGFVRVWDLVVFKQIAAFRAADFYTFDSTKRARAIGGIRGLAFSPDGTKLAISGIGAVTNVDGFVGPCRMELWDWRAGKRIAFAQDKHQAILNHVAFTPDGKWLIAVGGGDGGGAIVFWTGNETPPHVAKPKGHLQAFALGANSRLYAVGHGGFQVWQLD